MADVLSRIYDSESYKKNQGETRVVINTLSYQWTQKNEEAIRNITQKLSDTLNHCDSASYRVCIPRELMKKIRMGMSHLV